MNEDVMSSADEYSSSKIVTGISSSLGVTAKLEGGNYDSRVRFSAPGNATRHKVNQSQIEPNIYSSYPNDRVQRVVRFGQ